MTANGMLRKAKALGAFSTFYFLLRREAPPTFYFTSGTERS